MQSDTKFIEKFIEHYNNKFPDESKNFNLIEYLFLMQHYDIPTRLLDFSSDEMIALYFSVSSNIDLDKDSCNESEIKDFYKNNGVTNQGSSVHCIDPKLTNYYTNKFKNLKDDILNIDDITLDILLKIDLPLCIKTNNQNDRIKAQKGFFVLFGSDYKGYDEYTVLREKITKIFIPNSSRAKIKAELKQRYNISHSTIYPDMKGIALEITEEIKQDYKERLRIFQDK
jgi:hypothetical protein